MVGKRSSNNGYILTRYKLGLNAREIHVYKEICEAYGHNEVSYKQLLDGFENSSVVRSP